MARSEGLEAATWQSSNDQIRGHRGQHVSSSSGRIRGSRRYHVSIIHGPSLSAEKVPSVNHPRPRSEGREYAMFQSSHALDPRAKNVPCVNHPTPKSKAKRLPCVNHPTPDLRVEKLRRVNHPMPRSEGGEVAACQSSTQIRGLRCCHVSISQLRDLRA